MGKRPDQILIQTVVEPALAERIQAFRKELEQQVTFRRITMSDAIRALLIDALNRRDQEG